MRLLVRTIVVLALVAGALLLSRVRSMQSCEATWQASFATGVVVLSVATLAMLVALFGAAKNSRARRFFVSERTCASCRGGDGSAVSRAPPIDDRLTTIRSSDVGRGRPDRCGQQIVSVLVDTDGPAALSPSATYRPWRIAGVLGLLIGVLLIQFA